MTQVMPMREDPANPEAKRKAYTEWAENNEKALELLAQAMELDINWGGAEGVVMQMIGMAHTNARKYRKLLEGI